MNLLILNGPAFPKASRSYRGTCRAYPSFCTGLPQNHEINRLFLDWYLKEGGQTGLVHDFGKARRFMDLWNGHLGKKVYELVEVIEGDAPLVNNAEFLGFDISSGCCYSLLAAGMNPQDNCPEDAVLALENMMGSYFRPHMNSNGLFMNYDDAGLCLRVMKLLQTIRPNFYEGGDLSEFEVVSVHVLLGTEQDGGSL